MEIKQAALEVLLHNLHGPYFGLPRTAGWGYPEPYTRDLMISALGVLVSTNEQLVEGLQRVLETLAQNQSAHGHIHSLVHDPTDGGASDTTPLFLIALALFRKRTGQTDFLANAAEKALTWLAYQSPDDTVMVAHMPTSDWRDEEWVWGYGLYVNTLVYACLKLYGQEERARRLHAHINHPGFREIQEGLRIHEGLALDDKPHYAHWVYKIHINKRFDLLGNSLAIIFGLADHARAEKIINWVEMTIQEMQASGSLVCDQPPCLLAMVAKVWLRVSHYVPATFMRTMSSRADWSVSCPNFLVRIACRARSSPSTML